MTSAVFQRGIGMSSEDTLVPAHRLWTPEGFREDEWRHAESAEALEGNGNVILPLPVFLELDPALRENAFSRIGVKLAPGEPLDAIVPFLDRLLLVALVFPAYNDGRSYSKAELLRSRYGYRGDIRAVGDVLIDQVSHMLRCGFTSLEVTNPVAIARLKAGRPGGLSLYSQPSAATPGRPSKYAWRRIPVQA